MGECLMWILLPCVVSAVAADNPFIYNDQLLPEDNQPTLSLLLPLQLPVRFRTEANENRLEHNSQDFSTLDQISFDQRQFDSAEKQSLYDSSPSQLAAESVVNERFSEPQTLDDTFAFLTPTSLPRYQYAHFRYSPKSEEVKQPFYIVVPDSKSESPDKPIAVVPFRPPRRKPNKIVSNPPAPPARPESSLGLTETISNQNLPSVPFIAASNPFPTSSVLTTVSSSPYSAASAPYAPPSSPYAPASAPYAPASAPYAPASAPYAPESAPYAPASAPYAPASAPYAPESAPYAPPASAPYAAASPPTPMGKVMDSSSYAPSFFKYQPVTIGSEGDFRSGLFLGNSETPLPQPTFIFTHVHGRGLFDEGSDQLRLSSGSYSYLSPENIPVYMLEVTRR